MPLVTDWVSKLVLVTAPTISVSAQELHDFIEDEMASPLGLVSDGTAPFFGDIIVPEGKIEDPNKPGVFSQIILKVNFDWQIQFWQGSGYTTLDGGKYVGGVNGQVIKATGAAGDITVLESQVDGVITQVGSGLSTEQSTQLEELHGQVDRSVYLDPLVEVSGDGSQNSPYKTPQEAVDYVEQEGVRGVKLFNDLTLSQNMRNVFIEGINLPEFDPAGFDLKGTKLLNVKLAGLPNTSNPFIIQQSIIENDAGLYGYVEKCTFSGNCELVGHTHIVNCFSNKPGAGYVNLDTNGYILQVTNWRRSIGISNMTSGTHTIEIYGGQLHLDAGCTGGIIYLRGNYSLAPDNLGTTTIIDQTESRISNNNHAANYNHRKSIGLVDIIYDDDGITPLAEFDIVKDGNGEVIEIVPR